MSFNTPTNTYGISVSSEGDHFAFDMELEAHGSTDGRRIDIPLARLLDAIKSEGQIGEQAMLHIYPTDGEPLHDSSQSIGRESTLSFASGRGKIDMVNREIFIEQDEVRVAPKQFDIMAVLARSAGNYVLSQTLTNRVWPGRYLDDWQTGPLRVHLFKMRKMFDKVCLGAGDPETGIIKSKPSWGYQLRTEWPLDDLSGEYVAKTRDQRQQ